MSRDNAGAWEIHSVSKSVEAQSPVEPVEAEPTIIDAAAAAATALRGAEHILTSGHRWYLYLTNGRFAVEAPKRKPKPDAKGRTKPFGFAPKHADGSPAARLRYTLTAEQTALYLVEQDTEARSALLAEWKVEPVGNDDSHESPSRSKVSPTNDLFAEMGLAYGGPDGRVVMWANASAGAVIIPAATRGASGDRASDRKVTEAERTEANINAMFDAMFAEPEPEPEADATPEA